MTTDCCVFFIGFKSSKVHLCVRLYLWVLCLLTGELCWGRLISCQNHTHTSSILKNHTHIHARICGRSFMGRHCHHKWTGPSSLTNTSIKCSYSNNTGTKTEHYLSLPLFLLFFPRDESVHCMIFTQVSHRPGIHHTSRHGCQSTCSSFSGRSPSNIVWMARSYHQKCF